MSRTPALAAVAVAFLAGCGEPAAIEEPAPAATPQAPPPAAREAPVALSGELEPTPRPDLSILRETVREQVEQELAELEPLLADPDGERQELAERFGRLGRVYHAYGLHEPAATAYRNAERLAGDDLRWPYLRAAVAEKQGDTQTAEAALQRALELEPGHLPSLLRLAELRLAQGRHQAAEELFQEAVDQQPDSAAATHGLARVATAQGDHQEAVRRLKQVLELQPEANSVHLLLATAYRRVGDRQAAERHLGQHGPMPVIFDDPWVDGLGDLQQGVGVHLERGLRAFADGRPEEALAEYRKALALEPENRNAMRHLALTLATAGRADEALAAYDRMLEVYPDHQLASLERATVLLQRGRVDEAIVGLRQAIRQDPDFEDAHFNLATAYSRLDRWQEAADGFRQVLRLDRDNVEAHYSLGVALEELGQIAEAASELRLAIAASPDHLLARQRLGSVLERTGDPAGALEQYQAVIGLEAPDQEKALAHYQIGRLLNTLGRDEEAIASFRRAVELFPELWQARFAVANWLDRHNRHAEAADTFARLAAADPGNMLFRQREAQSLMGAGRFAQARRRLEEGLATQPRSFELASVLARLLATAPDAALRDGQRALELAESLYQAQRSIDGAETVAMALAELERYEEAASFQRQILAWAQSEGDAEAVARLRRNLSRYESGLPARQVAG